MKTIPLTQGYVALVDDADYPAVSAFNWHAQKMGRRVVVARSICRPDGSWTTQYLHQFLMPDVKRVDHEDGDSLNNRRGNLRPATSQQNNRGFKRKRLGATSRYRGVSWLAALSKWQSHIRVDGRSVYLGIFTDGEAAARAYDAAARLHFGEFACPNFP